jgi:hypothetical protein
MMKGSSELQASPCAISPVEILRRVGSADLILLRSYLRKSRDLQGGNNASSYLVHHRRFHRGLCRQGAHAYASVDHVDSGARHCRLNHRRCRDSSIFTAKRRRPISSRRLSGFHTGSDCSSIRLAQVQAANTSRVVRITPSSCKKPSRSRMDAKLT